MKNNKVWFITGASKGLGLSLVKQLLANGNKVAATSRNIEQLIKAVDYKAPSFLPLQVDLSNEDNVAEAIKKTRHTFGRIDVIVNNAGYGIGGSIEELTTQEIRDSFNINVFAAIHVIAQVLPILREQESGHIINISSIAGIAPGPGWAIYGAAKHAVIGLTEVLAEDVQEFGIKATVIAPGAFRTNFMNADSLKLSKNKIDAYTAIHTAQAKFLQMNGQQSGDPEKAAKKIIELAALPEPPVYLLLGSDAFSRACSKLDLLRSSFQDWRDWAKSTDY